MTTNRPQNSILVLATLGVFLGVMFGFAGTSVAQTIEATAEPGDIYINKRPLKVYVAELAQEVKRGSVKVSSPVKFSLTADIVTQSGSSVIKLSNVKLLDGSTGDEAMKKAAIDGVLAIGDSGWFGYLYKFGARKIKIDVEQTDSNSRFGITSELKDDKESRAVASGLEALTKLGRAGGTDGEAKKLLEFVSVSSTGAAFSVNISLPTATFSKMIEDSIGIQPALIK